MVNAKEPLNWFQLKIAYNKLMVPFEKFGKMFPNIWAKPKLEQYIS